MSDSEDEIQDWTQLESSVLKKGDKDYAPDGTSGQESALRRSQTAMFDALQHGRRHGKHVLKGVWDSAERACRVEQPKGTYLNTMGVHRKGVFLLNPEETLYLVQRGSLLLYLNGDLLSVEAAYAFCLSAVDQSLVLTYFHLRKLGYIVVRAPTAHFGVECNTPDTRLLEVLTGNFHTRFAWKRCYSSWDSIYRDLQFINSRSPPANETKQLTFHVWKPSTKYRKREPPPPDFYVNVVDVRVQGIPSLDETNGMLQCVPATPSTKRSPMARIKEGARTVVLAVVDSGIISFVKVTDTLFEKV